MADLRSPPRERLIAALVPDTPARQPPFTAAFNLRQPRHISVSYPDPELLPSRRSWWEVQPVELSRTLVETGKPPSPGAPARVERDAAGRRRLRDQQVAEQQRRSVAADGLIRDGLYSRELTDAETDLLLELLDIALAARVPVSGLAESSGAAHGARLTLRPHPESTAVDTVRGRLHLDRLTLAVEAR